MNICYIGPKGPSLDIWFYKQKNTYVNFYIADNFSSSTASLTKKNIEFLLKANHIIFSRTVFAITLELAHILKCHRIPYSYFTDDNFFVLRRLHLTPKVKRFFDNASNILLPTDHLINYFSSFCDTNKIIPLRLPFCPSSRKNSILKRKHSLAHEIHIGLMGTGKDHLYKYIIPELIEQTESKHIYLYLPKNISRAIKPTTESLSHKTSIIEFDFVESYEAFIDLIKTYPIDFFIQPAEIGNMSYRYKTLNTILIPYYTQALTLYSRYDPYSLISCWDLQELLVENLEFSDRLNSFINNEYNYKKSVSKLTIAVESNFSSFNNYKVLLKLPSNDSGIPLSENLLTQFRMPKWKIYTHKFGNSLIKRVPKYLLRIMNL